MTTPEQHPHSGSFTSKAAAAHRMRNLDLAAELVRTTGDQGLTVKEFRQATGLHHGVASALLSHLHKSGAVARLSETRARCHVYVAPEYILGRDTQPHGGRVVERDVAIKQVEAVRALHHSEIITEFGIPVFDEFDRPYRTYRGCRRCRVDWPCPTGQAVGLT